MAGIYGAPFVKTRDEKARDELILQGFILVSSANGTYTCINDKTQRFKGDHKKITYTEIIEF